MLYEIAGLIIDVKSRYQYTYNMMREYICSDQNKKADIVAHVTDSEMLKEKEMSPQFTDQYIENICIYRDICQQIIDYDRFLLHGSVISAGGKGYAFLGHSGAGKSTHSALWLKYFQNCSVINGDKPIIGYCDNVFTAFGTPWNGKEGLGENISAPLCGVCFIEQSKENKIVKLSNDELVTKIFNQLLIPEEPQRAIKFLGMIDKFVNNIPAYVLYCDISKEAAIISYSTLTGKHPY